MPRLLRRQLQFPRGSRRFSSVPSALSTSSLVEHWPNVSVVQDGITMLHSATGLPWWASIVASTLIFRAALVLPAGNSMATSRKFALIAPKVNQLALELKEKVNQGNISREDQVQFMQKRSEILNKYRIKQSQMFLPIIYQGFFFSTMFFALRSPNLPILDPSYSHGGFYSFVDLASQDTTYFLATANAVVLFANLYQAYRIFAQNPLANQNPIVVPLYKFMLATMPAGVFVASTTFPAGVNIYMLTSSLFQLVQTHMLHLPSAAHIFGIPRDLSEFHAQLGLPPPEQELANTEPTQSPQKELL